MAAPPRERGDAARNRERILAAARRLFAERDPATVSIDDIAAAAGVGKGTVFRRFGDRAGLAEALIDDEMRRFQDAFLDGPPPLGPGAPPSERLEAFVLGLLSLQHTNLPFALAASAGNVNPAAAAQPLLLHATALINELRSDIDPAVTAAVLLAAISPPAIAHARALGATPETLEASIRAFLHGLLPPGPGGASATAHLWTPQPQLE
jgi:AcrR family transcriptional regulator